MIWLAVWIFHRYQMGLLKDSYVVAIIDSYISRLCLADFEQVAHRRNLSHCRNPITCKAGIRSFTKELIENRGAHYLREHRKART